MIQARIIVCLALAACLARAPAGAKESNLWPFRVAEESADGSVVSWDSVGPLVFDEPSPAGGRVAGFRPFFVQWTSPSGEQKESTFLYPLFYYRTYGDTFSWSVFKLINHTSLLGGAQPTPDTESNGFDVWPIYFSRETGDSATSYHAVLPVAGTVLDLLGYQRISWVLAPLYVQTAKAGATTTYTPWPIVRSTRGAETGFAIWPLFGHDVRPGAFDRSYVLWPLYWDNTVQPGRDAAPGTPPTRQRGILPFYSGEIGPDVRNENYLLFFGSTDRVAPYRYHETRYLWPFLVQGSGDGRLVDRWGPFYTHSVNKGVDKTWYLWPLVRRTHWVEGDLAQDKTQFFFFFYWHQEQRSLSRPGAAPAGKTYLWPLFSSWDNGAGRRQVEVLSPFEGVFANQEEVRQSWSPLFAIWRYDRQAAGEERWSLFWNAITFRHNAAGDRSEFHLGPILSVVREPAGRRWRLFSLEFPSRRTMVSPVAALK